MADEVMTTTADLLDQEILGPMVQNNYQKNMVFMPLADVDRTLVGKEGDTIKVPMWTSKAKAQEVKEGADIPLSTLKQGYTTAKVKKFGIGIPYTDESDIERLGANATRATQEIGSAIAEYADDSLLGVGLGIGAKNTITTTLDIDGVDEMLSYFNTDKNGAYTIIGSRKSELALNKSVREYTRGSDVGATLAVNGATPLALGASFAKTNKMTDDKLIVVFSSADDIAAAQELEDKLKGGETPTEKELEALNTGRAFKWLMKRDTLIEPYRSPRNQTNYIYGTQIAAPYVQNPSKLLVVSISGGTGSDPKDLGSDPKDQGTDKK